jgi:hypothetical protein
MKQFIVFGQEGTEKEPEVSLNGLADSFKKVNRRIDTMQSGVQSKVEEVNEQLLQKSKDS